MISNNLSRSDQYKSGRKLDPDILGRICRLVFKHPVRVGAVTVATLLSSGFQLFIPRYLGKAVDNAQGLLHGTVSGVAEIEALQRLYALIILGFSILRGLFALVQNYFGESLNDCTSAELRQAVFYLSLIHISAPTRPLYSSYAVFCFKKKNS